MKQQREFSAALKPIKTRLCMTVLPYGGCFLVLDPGQLEGPRRGEGGRLQGLKYPEYSCFDRAARGYSSPTGPTTDASVPRGSRREGTLVAGALEGGGPFFTHQPELPLIRQSSFRAPWSTPACGIMLCVMCVCVCVCSSAQGSGFEDVGELCACVGVCVCYLFCMNGWL